jgi:ABC-2 type transport system ATP-binding protein
MKTGKLIACDTPAALKEKIGGDIISIASVDPDELSNQLQSKLSIKTARVDDILRIEKPRGHEWVPRIIEAVPGLVESISVGKPTLEDVFIRLTGGKFRDDQ